MSEDSESRTTKTRTTDDEMMMSGFPEKDERETLEGTEEKTEEKEVLTDDYYTVLHSALAQSLMVTVRLKFFLLQPVRGAGGKTRQTVIRQVTVTVNKR